MQQQIPTNQAFPVPIMLLARPLQVVTGGTGCSDYTTDLSGAFEVVSTGGWMTFEAESSYVQLCVDQSCKHYDGCTIVKSLATKGALLREQSTNSFELVTGEKSCSHVCASTRTEDISYVAIDQYRYARMPKTWNRPTAVPAFS